jgi:hypothetical protein
MSPAPNYIFVPPRTWPETLKTTAKLASVIVMTAATLTVFAYSCWLFLLSST